jgi:hypothetical protein
MSSSRSIAAARNRRAGDPPSQPQGKPMTSIASQSAFSQSYPSQNYQPQNYPSQNYQPQGYAPQNYPPSGPGKNARLSKSNQPPPQVNSNNLPFTKLSISDAIGLITLRLGRVEQFIIEFEEEGKNTGSLNIPDNMRLIDNSVLTNIVNRLDSLEKKETSNTEIIKMEKELKNNFIQIEELKSEIKEIKDMLVINMDSSMIDGEIQSEIEEEINTLSLE